MEDVLDTGGVELGLLVESTDEAILLRHCSLEMICSRPLLPRDVIVPVAVLTYPEERAAHGAELVVEHLDYFQPKPYNIDPALLHARFDPDVEEVEYPEAQRETGS